jgi:hypothetical protein
MSTANNIVAAFAAMSAEDPGSLINSPVQYIQNFYKDGAFTKDFEAHFRSQMVQQASDDDGINLEK